MPSPTWPASRSASPRLISGEGKLVEGKGPVRTGVTAILPRGRKFDPVFAAHHVLNGNGDMTGTHWVQESGFLETPILITNTGSVGVVRDAALGWMNRNKYFSPLDRATSGSRIQLVAETYDGVLNDMYGFHVKPEHVNAALDGAKSGPVAEGNVGGGTGMSCLGFKCGTGTASRRVSFGPTTNTVGVLVQANFGGRNQLTIAGVPVGQRDQGLREQMQLRPAAALKPRAAARSSRSPPPTRRSRRTSCAASRSASRLASAAPAAPAATDRATSSWRSPPPTPARSGAAARARSR